MSTWSIRFRATARLVGRGLLVGAAAIGIMLSSMPDRVFAGAPAAHAVAGRNDRAAHRFTSVGAAEKAGILDSVLVKRSTSTAR
jgi:hypothetical protein